MSPPIRNVVMALLVVLFITSTEADIQFPTTKTVRLTNSLASYVDMKVHCKSGAHDLGEQIVRPTESYEFSFKTNFLGTTLFFCSFQWGNEFHYFDVYKNGRDECSNCFWTIVEAGPCLYGDKSLCYQWNKN
ncbi:unnamed protein product [Prunus armeniaca]|uniref:S-protein homolog n=1 Tax=Prunus armeniaca TaxID=36596 RepID=A0A6J5VT29_PRUAR|nr:unnamed protein product [Prunus armeniaca]CAB4292520.1 unnamed protein product [Prunus armeniaca]